MDVYDKIWMLHMFPEEYCILTVQTCFSWAIKPVEKWQPSLRIMGLFKLDDKFWSGEFVKCVNNASTQVEDLSHLFSSWWIWQFMKISNIPLLCGYETLKMMN